MTDWREYQKYSVLKQVFKKIFISRAHFLKQTADKLCVPVNKLHIGKEIFDNSSKNGNKKHRSNICSLTREGKSKFPTYFWTSAVTLHQLNMKGNCSKEYLSSGASIVLSVWFSLSGLAAITGNVVVLWLFYKHKSLRTISNRFLASLSVADVFVGLVIDPVWIVIVCWIQPRGQRNLITLTKMLWIQTTAATTLNSCCVSIDRFTAIRFPFRYQDILTKRRCLAVIILVWFISLSLSFPILFFQPGKDRKELFVSITCTMFLAPLLVVSFCYIIIFKVARKQFGRILAAKKLPDSSENIRARVTQNFKAIKTVGFVLSACIITWMPSVVLLLVDFYYAKEERCRIRKVKSVVLPWVQAIAFTSSAINPLIYYLRNSDFRRAFRRTFHWLPFVHEQDALHLRVQPERNRLIRNVETCSNLTTKETEVWGQYIQA